jgi:membrane protein
MQSNFVHILKLTVQQWWADKVPQLSAALAFYSLLSIGPLLLIAISIAGLIFGQEAANGQIVGEFEGLIGKPGAAAIQEVIANSSKPAENIVAAILGVVMLFIGASAVFGQLQDALNTIWKAEVPPRKSFWFVLKNRLSSFAMVVVIGFLLLISLIISACLSALGTFFTGTLSSFAALIEIVSSIVGFAIITILFGMIFKILPDVKIRWRDIWSGALLSAFLFTIGKSIIAYYLGSAAISTTYGAAGSFVVLALWVYYSALILFFGAELTYVYSDKFHTSKSPRRLR